MFDLSKAYDSVDHGILINKLEKVLGREKDPQVQESFVLIKHILSSIKIRYKEGQDNINVNCGVPQGYILSPALFNIYINDLVSGLDQILGVVVHAYADDLAIICDSRIRLQEAIKKIEDWCVLNKMKCNKEKSHIIYLPKQKAGKKSYMKGSISQIKLVRNAKYLGIILDRDLMYSGQI